MKDISKERRKYQRYDLETKVHFYVKDFNLVTKVRFRKLIDEKDVHMAKEFAGISRNVSVEGIRFCSLKKLKAGESLFIKVYLPKSSKPIPMVGEVRWSKKVISAKDK
ncbi:MAG: PilZ domain-containing protein, partial [Candidatus Omnitrophica bacterium]|nr:PilZ domain-containing protein [Candidatus Omnitrophota bacterium]